LDAGVLGRPEGGVGGAEEEEAWQATGGGEVADAAVVAKEACAGASEGLETRDQGGKGNLVPAIEGDSRAGDGVQGAEEAPFLFGFAGDDEDAEGARLDGGEGVEDG
jgi:hypothetical protein